MLTGWKVVGHDYGTIWHKPWGARVWFRIGDEPTDPNPRGLAAWRCDLLPLAMHWAARQCARIVELSYDPADLIIDSDPSRIPGEIRLRRCRVVGEVPSTDVGRLAERVTVVSFAAAGVDGAPWLARVRRH